MKNHWKLFKIVFCLIIVLGWVSPPGYAAGAAGMEEFNRESRLAVLCKVWGFLKYYHPDAADGNAGMDQVLVSAIGPVKAAGDAAAFNIELQRMIVASGWLNFFALPVDLEQTPVLDWMQRIPYMDGITIQLLRRIKTYRVPREANYYVEGITGVGNPIFKREKPYPEMQYPSEEYRLLSLFRYWNIIDYFFPYKDVIGENWEDVLLEFIPKLMAVPDAVSYHLAVREFTARINDTHGGTSSKVLTEQWWGEYYSPFRVRYIENQTVVAEIMEGFVDPNLDMRLGDVVVSADGVPAAEIRSGLRKYVQGSNEGSLHYFIGFYMSRGHTDRVQLVLSRGGVEWTVVVPRYLLEDLYPDYGEEEEEPPQSEQCMLLAGNIGYVDMDKLKSNHDSNNCIIDHVGECMTALMGTKAIIFDTRNYPHSVLYDLARYLNPVEVEFVKFTIPDMLNPGLFTVTDPYYAGPEEFNADYYKGKVVVLFDERTVSHAEFTCMAFKTAPDVIFIGSPTSGADGNVSQVFLPGSITTAFSGIGVFYPDGGQTQRVGILPDIEVRPTIAGLQAGRDEVLEKALEYIAAL
ncbi:MAG: hypothetical protein GY950_11550 [bacterium]|nr:hypothetical protein [bacterium]